MNRYKFAHIPIYLCRHKNLYHIEARNACVGVYNVNRASFTVPRWKGEWYLFEEFHYDSVVIPRGLPNGQDWLGTVRPIKRLEYVPEYMFNRGHPNKLFLDPRIQEDFVKVLSNEALQYMIERQKEFGWNEKDVMFTL